MSQIQATQISELRRVLPFSKLHGYDALDDPYPISKIKENYSGKILCVDVLGVRTDVVGSDATEQAVFGMMKAAGGLSRIELAHCDLVMSVPTEDIGFLNFDAKADLIERGKAASKKFREEHSIK
jgi:predicted acylesterase/phospholipase RssA